MTSYLLMNINELGAMDGEESKNRSIINICLFYTQWKCLNEKTTIN